MIKVLKLLTKMFAFYITDASMCGCILKTFRHIL